MSVTTRIPATATFWQGRILKFAEITKTGLIFVLGNTLANAPECRSHPLTAFLHSGLYYNNTTQNYAVLRAHLVWRFPKTDFV